MILLTPDPIDVAAAERLLHAPRVGGIVTFTGTVRDHSHDRTVLHLEYESYPEMAQAQLEAIARAMAERWPLEKIVLIHRIGRLEIGDVAVFVGAASAHRGTAFEACRYGIDTVKAEVPIWKREFFAGGDVWIDDCCTHA